MNICLLLHTWTALNLIYNNLVFRDTACDLCRWRSMPSMGWFGRISTARSQKRKGNVIYGYLYSSDCNFLANLSFTKPRLSPIFLTRLHETTRPEFFLVDIASIFIKVHIFLEGHKILRKLLLTFEWHYIVDFKKICGLLRIYELLLYQFCSMQS